MNQEKKKPDPMKAVASAIVRYRFIIYILFAAACVYCAMSVGKVKVNSDITAFLPEQTETRRGLTVMEEEFITYGSAEIMVSNVTQEHAQELADRIAEVDGVFSVDFDDTTAHYKGANALFSVTFDGTEEDESAAAALNEIKAELADYDTYISTEVGEDFYAQLASEMGGVIVLAAIVIVAVLLFTSRSYFEVVIFFIVFVVAALLNMGTNFWLGTISSITNSVAIILQLALAIDYAIIFSHRYQDEVPHFDTPREALIEALSKAIIEISSSSLTTIAGLVALTLMQFGLGRDLGLVLSKGILCSLLTVFLLMPGLIALFPKALSRTAHRNLIPDITPWGRFLMKTKVGFVVIFALLLVPAIYCSTHVTYAFDDNMIDELVYSESRAAVHKIAENFDNSTAVALLVPSEDFESEKAITEQLETLDGIKSVTGLSTIQIDDDHTLTDSYTPQMFADLLGIDVEEATLLYAAYGAENNEFQAIFGDSDAYSVPLVDMFLYLFEKVDQGIVTLDDDTMNTLTTLRSTLVRGIDQLRGENWNRIVLTATVDAEGQEARDLVEEIRAIAEEYYGEGSVLVIGDITSARDLSDSFNSDSVKINLLTIAFVFIILLFTFRTVIGAVVLVFVIQGAIWFNFGLVYVTDFSTSFVTNMIVSAIQMGATIDYAIVIMNRYLALKENLPKREAMAATVNESFATVFTSGSIMTVAGLLIGYRVSDVYVGHIGFAVGRGALISVILVLTVLPQLIVLLDTPIEKTRFRLKLGGSGK